MASYPSVGARRASQMCGVLLFTCMFGGCASPGRSLSVGDPMRWDAVRAKLPTVQAYQTADTTELPTLHESATLNDYLAYAALNNPGLEAAFNRWRAALERVPQEKSLPDPRFTYRYFIRTGSRPVPDVPVVWQARASRKRSGRGG
jgi:outer membrane protein TolC